MVHRSGEDRGAIRLRGVRQNNLKGIDLDLPLGKLTVVTGVSGSGKSSLAFDTLYAEGQRRYLETFSAYTRQFFERMPRPDADAIEGVPPAVAIDQSGAIKTSRSTVGTLTGINDYLKLLFARAAVAACPSCRRPLAPGDAGSVLEHVEALDAADFPLLVLAPVPLGGFSDVGVIANALRSQGYLRFLRAGETCRIEELGPRDLAAEALDVVVDRIPSPSATRQRLADSIEQALRAGRGTLRVRGRRGARTFTSGMRCGDCRVELPSPVPGLFSFNTPYGACPRCRGFGRTIGIDWSRVVPDASLSIRGGAIRPWTSATRRNRLRRCLAACKRRGIDVERPWNELSDGERRIVLEGDASWDGVRGFFERLEEKKYKMHVRVLLSRYRGYFPCEDCGGARLRPEALAFRVEGLTLPEMWRLPVRELLGVLEGILRHDTPRPLRLVVEEVASRLRYLVEVGLGYLTLDRQSRTLSGGEVERVNLTAALGAALVDTLFVLDEPSIGLHARDNERLLGILRRVRDRGNTVVVVEHDTAIVRAADHIVDLGPGSGARGGEVVACGGPEAVAASAASLTGAYLAGRKRLAPPPRNDCGPPLEVLKVRGARQNNLQGLDVDIPTDRLTVVTGVSGSGKSSLLHDVVWRAYLRSRGEAVDGEVDVEAVEGFELVREVVMVDQSPIGRTPRGNPATYTKLFDRIRDLFAASAEARDAGLGRSAFSFNVEGGRCPECAGAGAVQVEMQFLSDVTLPCEACGGKRFRGEVLRVRVCGCNVHEVLQLTVAEAIEFFAGDPELEEKLRFLENLGLGYLRLGQPIHTLSGGEAQRLKLAGKVLEARRGRLLFLIDEPTTGLHIDDVGRLLEVLRGLVERGHGVVVIEHHLDVIAAADHVIDLGPEGGDQGGRLVAEGPPHGVAACEASITGAWLRRRLADDGARGDGDRPVVAAIETAARKRSARERQVIRVVGARENNLRNLSVEIPRNCFVVVTGLSGAGKSSLVYDVVFAEGQRRYLDCLSPYARQFVEVLHRPDLDHLEGIPPTVAIEQRSTVGGRKSTVGTVTEVYHFLRLLFARAGRQVCPACKLEVAPRSVEEITAALAGPAHRGGWLLAPVVRGRKGFHSDVFSRARKSGILEARVDGEWVAIPEDRELRLDRRRTHDVDLVVRRLRPGAGGAEALAAGVRAALEWGGGVLRFLGEDGGESLFSLERSCPGCGMDFDEPEPRSFSFHSRRGACPDCAGHGYIHELDPERLFGRWDLPIDHAPGGPLEFFDAAPFPRGLRRRFLRALEEARPSSGDGAPLSRWSDQALRFLFAGGPRFEGLRGFIHPVLDTLDPEEREAFLVAHGKELPCTTCGGTRLQRRWGAVEVGGARLPELAALPIAALRPRLSGLRLDARPAALAAPVLEEIDARLEFLERVGLGYLTLDRSAATLSSGEAQRIRLGAQLGSNLRGACYILDEPTIGLHPRDNDRLLSTLRDLRDRGNSLIVVEHDEATIRAADEVLDMGPGPGRRGGEVVAQGSFEKLLKSRRSLTAKWFRESAGRRLSLADDPLASRPRLVVRDAARHNLKGVSACFPLAAVTAVTGVSGAGKSTLVRDVLEEGIRRMHRGLCAPPVGVGGIEGAELVAAVREVDQLPIGRTPRSTPVTYVGFWDAIRRIFAALPESRARGYDARRFSFNVPGGRCESCTGQGRIRMEMNFLPDVTVDCEACRGGRFNAQTLEVTYRGKNIAEVLALTVEEARDFFSAYPEIGRPLAALEELGLGYLALGQASTTLSGGEAQRVKLAVELAKGAAEPCLYLFDEPTTGLHMLDVERLVSVLRRLSRTGHAVVVIEHHLEVIAGADWVVDLGPDGGEGGGRVLYEGPVAGLLGAGDVSHTAGCLREHVRRGGAARSRKRRDRTRVG
jgi:excinuclease ABC subunit A